MNFSCANIKTKSILPPPPHHHHPSPPMTHERKTLTGIAGHHERVRARERRAQLVPLQLPGEDGVRALEVRFQLLLLRTGTDDAQPRARTAPLERRPQVLEALLGAEPPHVHHEEVPRVAAAHPLPDRGAPEFRMEPYRVDSLPPNVHARHAVPFHLLLHLRTRHERQVGPAVHEPQRRPRHLLDAGHEAEVVPPVERKVGVVRQEQRHAHDPGVEEPREEHESRGGDVYQVRTVPLHHPRSPHLREVDGQADVIVQGEDESLCVLDGVTEDLGGELIPGRLGVDGEYVDHVPRLGQVS